MSKFKIGDRVRLLSDAWAYKSKECGWAPRFGRAGEVGVIAEDGGDSDGVRGWYVGEVGEYNRGWFAEEQLEHADPQPPVAHHDRVVADTHAAIDRLVTHIERQATEHVHALDALRAEVEALRTQNAHLRALQAAGEAKPAEAKPVREVVRGTYCSHPMMREPDITDPEDGRHAIRFTGDPDWTAYDAVNPPVRNGLTEPEAIAWVLDGVLPARTASEGK